MSANIRTYYNSIFKVLNLKPWLKEQGNNRPDKQKKQKTKKKKNKKQKKNSHELKSYNIILEIKIQNKKYKTDFVHVSLQTKNGNGIHNSTTTHENIG